MAFDIFYQSFVWTSAESMRQNNVIKKSTILEENGNKFVVENFIESTVKFALNDMDVWVNLPL